MPAFHRSLIVAGSCLTLSLVAAPRAAHAQAAKLDDPTIVAIFDAANTWDIETGTLA